MLNERMVRNLLGTDQFTELLARLPDEFFRFSETIRNEFFYTLLIQLNDGCNFDWLVTFARTWIGMRLKIQQTGLILL